LLERTRFESVPFEASLSDPTLFPLVRFEASLSDPTLFPLVRFEASLFDLVLFHLLLFDMVLFLALFEVPLPDQCGQCQIADNQHGYSAVCDGPSGCQPEETH
jgi:hypothetical protein